MIWLAGNATGSGAHGRTSHWRRAGTPPNRLEGFALAVILQGFTKLAASALLLKLARHDIVGGAVFFVGLTSLTKAVAYALQMPTIKRTDEFSNWLRDLRDIRARAKVLARIDRLSLGNPGDIAPVGDGVSEMRIHYGPGYRVYYIQRGEEIVVLLCGGDKGSQASDIKTAKKLASELED